MRILKRLGYMTENLYWTQYVKVISNMAGVKINTQGFINRLNRIEKKLDSIPWDKTAQVVLNSVRQNFELGGRYSQPKNPMGGASKWTPRKDSSSHKILKKSGALQAANKIEVHKNGFAILNKLEYQAVHNFGYPKMNIPARPFLVVQENDMKDMKVVITNHIKSW